MKTPVRTGHRLGDKKISFRFDGKTYQGFEGDTAASALLAAGTRLFGRSVKYHRPRGLLSAGFEEPNALLINNPGEFCISNLPAPMPHLAAGHANRQSEPLAVVTLRPRFGVWCCWRLIQRRILLPDIHVA